MLCFIVAASENGVIGSNGAIPWKVPGEQAYFKRMTMGHPIVMGRKTYEAIGKPLPGRANYVITRQLGYTASGCQVIGSIEDVLTLAQVCTVFVIGGQDVFDALFPFANRIYLTVIHRRFEGDTYFPRLDLNEWMLVEKHRGPSEVLPHTFYIYDRRSS